MWQISFWLLHNKHLCIHNSLKLPLLWGLRLGSWVWTSNRQSWWNLPWSPPSNQQMESHEAWRPSLWPGLLWGQMVDSSPSDLATTGASLHQPRLSWYVWTETHRAWTASYACGVPSSHWGCQREFGLWCPPRRSVVPQWPSSPPSPSPHWTCPYREE